MKGLLRIVLFLLLNLNLISQTANGWINSRESFHQQGLSGEAKSEFISSQKYLSPSSLKDFKEYYGDSLKGFNEKEIKADLLAKNVFGEEYEGYIRILKRSYINQKYGIGTKPEYVTNPTGALPIGLSIPKGSNGKTIGGNNLINVAPCVNEDFELTPLGVHTTSNAVAGWTLMNSTANGCNYGPWSPGSSEFSIVATPIVNFPCVGTIPNSPLGGTRVARLNNQTSNSYRTKISTQFPVTSANTLFQFAFAGFYQNPGHGCCDQPGLFVRMLNCSNQVLSCSSITLSAGCPAVNATFSTCTGGAWTNWQVKYIDLTPYIGTCVTFECWTTDCSFGGHYGTTVFDARCGGQLVGQGLSGVGNNVPGPVSFCAGSGLAQISAPLGYASYTWVSPPGSPAIPPAQATLSTINVLNPVPNSVYTVYLTSPSGCAFTATNAITPSTVNIAGIGTTTTCLNGSSGSATIQGNGSGAGYTYNWLNSASLTIGTNSVITGLGPGIYSVVIAGLGSAGCGSAATTVTINAGPPSLINVLKPYCNGLAFLNTAGGSNFQWYQGSSLITGTVGTASGYTVVSPANGQIYHLSYLSNQGCQDSVKFTLAQTPAGIMNVNNISLVCPGANNGTAAVSMTPAAASPWGINSYSVFNNGTLAPIYNASLYPTSSNIFTLSGLSSGNYIVKTFDGSCSYTTSFNVNAFVYNYSLSPVNATLCPGNTIAASVNFSSSPAPGQYSYSWTPSTWLVGGNTTAQSNFISPTVAIGTTSTVIYNITVTPSLVNCPITKTIAITAVSPIVPTINPIPNLCDNALPYAISVNPPGGSFSSVGSTTIPPIGSSTGLMSPTLSLIGLNTFTYSIIINTCVVTQTATYQVSKFYPSALTSTISPLCVTNAPVNLMNIVQNTVNGSWTGPGVAGNLFVPSTLQTNNYVLTYSTFSSPNPTVCPSTTTLNISVTNTITPVITAVPPFCTNAASFAMVVNPGGGVWAGSPAVSSTGIFTPSLALPGLNIITTTVFIGPCANINSTILDVSQFNSAAFSSTVPNLCGTGAPFNLMSIVQTTAGGVWSAPQGIISNSFFPGGIATNTYTIYYNTSSQPNATLCPDSRTIAVSVLNPPIPIITQVGPFCSKGSAIQLSVTPDIGTWVASGYVNSTGILTPSLCVIGANPVQYIIGTSTCNSQQTKFFNVEAFETAELKNPLHDLCNTSSPVNLLPITQSNKGVWSGPGISGTSFNPGVSGAGSFVLTYNTSSSPSGLCPDQSTVAVNVYSLAAPSITSIKRMCNSAPPVKLQVSPVGGLFGGANNTAVSNAGLFNPASAVIGDNVVNYSITSGPCVAYGQTTVVVEKFVSADFSKYPKSVYCQTLDKPINMDQFVTTPGGTWSGSGMVGNMFNPDLADVGTNNLIIYQTHSMPTATLCPDTSAVRLVVGDIPKVSAKANVLNGCAPLEVVLNIPETDFGTATWIFGDGTDPKQDMNISHVYTTPGSYTATLNYVSKLGCPAAPLTVSPAFTVYELPAPDFSLPDEVLISDPMVQLTNLTSGISSNKYQWRIEGLSQVNTEVSPRVEFPKIGRYNVTLTAETPNGCKADITKSLEIKNDFNIFIPSSFSPNYDGLNDVFIPVFSSYGLDTKSFEMEIFDRWGHSLFRSKDATKGWDGTVNNKGEQVKEEVYVYKIKYKDLDGNLYNKIGHLSLIK